MKIVVIGSGRIGTRLVNKLREHGQEVLSASPSSGVDTITRAGLGEAMTGAQVVVDVADSPSFEDGAVLNFFETSTRNLLAAGTEAGIRHHLVLSVVGADRLPESGYMRAKVAQENLIKTAALPYTILRVTQFFEFIGRIADSCTQGGAVHLPPVLMQPLAADDVAGALADIALGPPVNSTIELAGPESLRMDELARRVLSAKQDARSVVPDPSARYFGHKLNDRSLIPADNPRVGTILFEEWLVTLPSKDRPVGEHATDQRLPSR